MKKRYYENRWQLIIAFLEVILLSSFFQKTLKLAPYFQIRKK